MKDDSESWTNCRVMSQWVHHHHVQAASVRLSALQIRKLTANGHRPVLYGPSKGFRRGLKVVIGAADLGLVAEAHSGKCFGTVDKQEFDQLEWGFGLLAVRGTPSVEHWGFGHRLTEGFDCGVECRMLGLDVG